MKARCLFLVCWLGVVSAASADPLTKVPDRADVVLAIPNPGRFVDALYKHPVVEEFLKIPGVREQIDTNNLRRLQQLLGYIEKRMERNGRDLIDGLAGNGLVLAGSFYKSPGAGFVLEAKDAKLLEKFLTVALEILDGELDRQQQKVKVEKGKYFGLPGIKIDKAHVVVDGPWLFAASDGKILKAVLDLHQKKGKGILDEPSFVEARKHVPADALSWHWYNLGHLQANKEFSDGLKTVREEPTSLLVFGGLFDVTLRASYALGVLTQDGPNLTLRHTMPAGRVGMPDRVAAFYSNEVKKSLPPLETPGVLASWGYQLDVKHLWVNRAKLFGKKELKDIEDAEKNSGRFLLGTRLETLFEQMGAQHRFIVAQSPKALYKVEPKTKLPAFGYVVDMRDPKFGKNMNTILRTAALIGAVSLNMKMTEEKIGDVNLVTYRFPEDKEVGFDKQNIRFNFTPCFAIVGDYFLVSSTTDLGRDLVAFLKNEPKDASPIPVGRLNLYGSGGALAVETNRDQLMAATLLQSTISPEESQRQLDQFADWVRRLGSLQVEVRYGQNDFEHAMRWKVR